MPLAIDSNRLTEELETLATFSEVEPPAVTRVVFSDTDLRARRYVKSLCAEAGLSIREDAIGNTFARWPGADDSLPPAGTGSHIDAIPHAGRYDGTVGVLGGLEAIRALQRSGFQPRRSIELIVFTAEEPTRFGVGCLGSRMISGSLNDTADENLRDKEGRPLREFRAAAGFTASLFGVRLKQGHYAAFIELHIEQGPLLEREGLSIGLVSSIAAPASVRIWFEGEGGHAGAMLMPDRHDAFLAAAEIALALEAAVKATGAIDTVGTTGVCDVFPGAINSVPSKVRLEVDVRDVDVARRNGVLAELARTCLAVSGRRGVAVRTEMLNSDPPAQCAPELLDALSAACARHGITSRRMVSRAYHDSLFMARIAPVAMVFIPCRSGFSHRPDEYASPEAIAEGALVLAEALAAVSA
ncbi:MAG TPA: M20 family metallo-hydrolase [Bryobacteraceae bacterium]|jgi:N-carbamoyl-L-amino-acid hydrolase|nr:M20 family metallo-hydrolase [Bryobacteraceae bacterium]